MRKKRRNIQQYTLYFLALVLFSSMVFSGCGSKADEDENHQGDDIFLYYLNGEEDDFIKVSYTLENRNDPEKESREVLSLLSNIDTLDRSDCKASIPKEVAVNSIKISKGRETIDFGAGYRQMSSLQEALMRISVVETVCQIDGVDKVSFTVNGEELLDHENQPLSQISGGQIILSDDFDTIYSQEKKVTLYYADSEGSKLVPVTVTLKAKDNMPMAERIIQALKTVPKGREGLLSPIPKELQVNQTQIVGNTCYIDVNTAIENLVPDVEEEITIYSIVNSIASLDENYSVQFTVEGQRIPSVNRFKNFDRLLKENQDLTRKEKE